MTGRFAPSPTGDLHVGNLRTALLAWLAARADGRRFLVRMEDLDRANSSPANEDRQLADLRRLGLDWDGVVVRQSDRFARYDAAIAELSAAGLTYECFCTRREIREAPSAPHGPLPDGAYPGTCRDLSSEMRVRRRRERSPAVRLRGGDEMVAVDDMLAGRYAGVVDDVVLRRSDGVPAYNLAVVVDDAAQGVTEVVRGRDLLESTPRQVLLQRLLGVQDDVRYVHVPLVVGEDGERLAKRDGAITLRELAAAGVPTDRVRAALATSLGLAARDERPTPAALVARFDVALVAARGPAPVSLDDLHRSWAL